MKFNRNIFFDKVRAKPFNGSLTQQQVDGMNFKLDVWERDHGAEDMRWLAYALATSYHETAQKMWPVEENGKGAGHEYGKQDQETKQTYYGRGDVQMTWRENYAKATQKLGLTGADDLEWHAARALDPSISARAMYRGMIEGWYRGTSSGRNTFAKYFNATTNAPYNAREIINGDKAKVPNWSNGVSIGNLIKGYHTNFLAALDAAAIEEPASEVVTIAITVPDSVNLHLTVNGKLIS